MVEVLLDALGYRNLNFWHMWNNTGGIREVTNQDNVSVNNSITCKNMQFDVTKLVQMIDTQLGLVLTSVSKTLQMFAIFLK